MTIETFREEGFPSSPGQISEALYDQILRSMPIVCADVAVIDRNRKILYLAPRRALPYRGWWVVGGRQKRGQSNQEAAVSHLKRDTGLEINPERLEFVCVHDYMSWEPKSVGSHTVAITYALELTSEELTPLLRSDTVLQPDEYAAGGLRPFTHDVLTEAAKKGEAHEAMLRLYDKIFPR